MDTLGEEAPNQVLGVLGAAPYRQPPERVLSGRISRIGLIGLKTWHAEFVSANQDLHFQSL